MLCVYANALLIPLFLFRSPYSSSFSQPKNTTKIHIQRVKRQIKSSRKFLVCFYCLHFLCTSHDIVLCSLKESIALNRTAQRQRGKWSLTLFLIHTENMQGVFVVVCVCFKRWVTFNRFLIITMLFLFFISVWKDCAYKSDCVFSTSV